MIDDDSLKSIEKLHQLKTDGVISEQDFEKSKERILFGATKPKIVRPELLAAPAVDDRFAWATLPLRRYADFTGRSSRQEFWMFQLIYVALFVVTVIIVSADTKYGEVGTLGNLTILLAILGALGLAVPLLAVEVRRFHDQDRSGWFALLNLVPYFGPLIVFAFMLVEGTHGENQFGPDPITR